MTSLISRIKSKAEDLFKKSPAVLAFKIHTSAINELPSSHNNFIEFLMEVAGYATCYNIAADVHFAYQKTKRERHRRLPVFERSVVIVLRGRDSAKLEAAYAHAQAVCTFSSEFLVRLPTAAASPLELKNVKKEYISNQAIDFVSKIGNCPFYVRSFISLLDIDLQHQWDTSYATSVTRANLEDIHRFADPSIEFLVSLAKDEKNSPPEFVIEFSSLNKFFEKEYYYHDLPSSRSHAFSGINNDYCEFLSLGDLSFNSNIAIMLDETSDFVDYEKIRYQLEHNLLRSSHGFVEFFPGVKNEFYNITSRNISELSCYAHAQDQYNYTEFFHDALVDLADTAITQEDKYVISRLFANTSIAELVDCLEHCLTYEEYVNRKTLSTYLSYKSKHLIKELSDQYRVSCSFLNKVISGSALSLADLLNNHCEKGLSIFVEEDQSRLFSFIVKHLCKIERPVYKGSTLYVYLPLKLYKKLSLSSIRALRSIGVIAVVYEKYSGWREHLKTTNREDLYIFSAFFINCNVFDKNQVISDLDWGSYLNVETVNTLKQFDSNHYYVQSYSKNYLKQCVVKL